MENNAFFVNIKTVFNNTDDRNIAYLSKYYMDLNLLKSTISEVTGDHLKNKQIEGKRILLKPNWVLHNRKENDEICMRTHDNLLLAFLEVILLKKPLSVVIGDAPVQGCRWDDIIRCDFKDKINELSRKYVIPIKIKDFRRVTFDPLSNNITVERNPITDYIIFDLKNDSLLEPISKSGKNLFRVTDYDPDRLAESHGPGIHKYCITKELFESDVIITIPKVKTHQKAGITNALKILVGINGDKDFLPHHRKGGTNNGGDCYPGDNILLKLSEYTIDTANRHRGKFIYKPLKYIAIGFWKLSNPSPKHNLAASWHGNDTTWRMTLDLNKIAVYGKDDGTISKTPQRVLFSLCDGIIGGQGDGPLKADPLALGVICFSNIPSYTDAAMAEVMGFEQDKIPLVKNAIKIDNKKKVNIFLDQRLIALKELSKISILTIPPPGWVDYL
jgi:uncharacterized protein (DUF362 family)